MPLDPSNVTCVKILNCCGRRPCCPDTTLPDTLEAVVTSTCAPLNGTVTLTRYGGPNDPACWTGDLTISGCFDCTVLRVDLCCEESVSGTGTVYHWDLAWSVFRSDGELCVVTSTGEPSVLTESCGPPFGVTRTDVDQTLTDPGGSGGVCCAGFSITIEVTGP